jgi:hypothetical protein
LAGERGGTIVCGDENEDPGNRIDERLMCRDVGFGR